jgi:hypothetical protein
VRRIGPAFCSSAEGAVPTDAATSTTPRGTLQGDVIVHQDDLVCGKKITASAWIDGAMAERGLVDLPYRLYKCLSPSSSFFDLALEDAFLKSRMFLATTSMFNDPFDAQIDIASLPRKDLAALLLRATQISGRNIGRGDRRHALRDLRHIQNTLRESIKEQIDNIGIHCVTERWDNLLMWSHYANGHQGIALIYARSETEVFNAVPVRYRPTYPVLRSRVDIQDNIGFHTVLRKADIWSYEREWRFFALQGARKHLPLPANALHGVIFGLNASIETKERVERFAAARRDAGLSPLTFYQATRARGVYGVGLARVSDGVEVSEP